MTLTENQTGRIVGSVHDPWQCCNPYYELKDSNKNLRYRIMGACCQKGFFCCSDIFFNIYPATGEMNPENIIGKITKKWTDCVKEVCTKANNYVTDFPLDATADDKILLIGITLLVDYTIFEKEDRNRN